MKTFVPLLLLSMTVFAQAPAAFAHAPAQPEVSQAKAVATGIKVAGPCRTCYRWNR